MSPKILQEFKLNLYWFPVLFFLPRYTIDVIFILLFLKSDFRYTDTIDVIFILLFLKSDFRYTDTIDVIFILLFLKSDFRYTDVI